MREFSYNSTTYELQSGHEPKLATSGSYIFISGIGVIRTRDKVVVIPDHHASHCFFGPTDDFAVLSNQNVLKCFRIEPNVTLVLTNPLNDEQFPVGFNRHYEFLFGEYGDGEPSEHSLVKAVDLTTFGTRTVCKLDETEYIADHRASFDIYTVDEGSFCDFANCIRDSFSGAKLQWVNRAIRLLPTRQMALTRHLASDTTAGNYRNLFADTEPSFTDECVRLESADRRILACERFSSGTIAITHVAPDESLIAISGWDVRTSKRTILLDSTHGNRLYDDPFFDLTFFASNHFLRLRSSEQQLLAYSIATFSCIEKIPIERQFLRGLQSSRGNAILLYDSMDEPKLAQLLMFSPEF